MGLIARAIEREGISTVTISIYRELAEQVKPPRVVTTKFPFGAPLGDPNNIGLHRRVILDALQALTTVQVPGTIVDLPYKWREIPEI